MSNRMSLIQKIGSMAVLMLIILVTGFGNGQAQENITMYLGEVSVIELGKVDRVAIGNPKIASNTILPNGQFVLLADAVGVTTVHIWLSDATEQEFSVTVIEKQNLDNYYELTRLLQGVPGVNAIKIGDLIVVKGTVARYDDVLFKKIMERYNKGVLNLVIEQNSNHDIKQLLVGIPNVQVQELNGTTVVRGEVSKEYDKIIQTIQGKYPRLLNLTRVQPAIADTMIYMKVRIMEVDNSITENLGIDWDVAKGIIGPSAEFGVELSQDSGTILNAKGTSKVLTTPGGSDLTTARGYFGIASGITSVLNLYEGTGDAVTLAEPRLSTRSGGKAEFLAGGEIPMPVTSAQGQSSVQFKKYGIILNIQPTMDEHGNILAHIETEISTIDKGVTVDGIPGTKNRKTSTDISMRPEETLVIAGLLKDLVGKDYDNVKWLADIPILGNLFKSKKFKNNHSELVIFVTPYAYDADSKINRENLLKLDEMELTFKQIVKGNALLE